MATKSQNKRVRQQGRDDYAAGKPITAYYDMPLKRHTESMRGFYEMGWREARDEARKAEAQSTPESDPETDA